MRKKVTKKHAWRMLEVLPPTTWFNTNKGEIFQVGEVSDHIAGLPRFATYERIDKQWFYRGLEHKIRGRQNIMESEHYLDA